MYFKYEGKDISKLEEVIQVSTYTEKNPNKSVTGQNSHVILNKHGSLSRTHGIGIFISTNDMGSYQVSNFLILTYLGASRTFQQLLLVGHARHNRGISQTLPVCTCASRQICMYMGVNWQPFSHQLVRRMYVDMSVRTMCMCVRLARSITEPTILEEKIKKSFGW